MYCFIAFFVWLISIFPAAIIADWPVDGFSNPLQSPSEAGNSNQASRFDEDFGSELIVGTSTDCAPDNIQDTTKLRARLDADECETSKTSNDDNGKKPTGEGEEEKPPNLNDNNGHNPNPLIWLPPRPLLPLLVPESSKLCPPTEFRSIQYLVCHQGPDTEIHEDGEWIENAISCDEFFRCQGTRWCCLGFWPQGYWQIIWPLGDAYVCKPANDNLHDLQIPGLSL